MFRNLLTLIALLIIIPGVLGLQIVANSDLPTYVCSPATHSFSIVNDGTETEGVGLFSSVEYVSYSPDSFWLPPGEAQTVQILLRTPCDATNTPLVTQIVNVNQDVLKLNQNILVVIPENIVLVSPNVHAETSACGSADYEANLTNPINFTETYSFSIESPGIEFTVPNNITILPGETEHVSFRAVVEDCELTGEQKISIKTSTEKTQITAVLPIILNISAEGVPEIIVPKIYFTKTSNSTVIIKNLGNSSAVFTLSLVGADWASINPTTLNIPGGAYRAATIFLVALNESTRTELNLTVHSEEIGKDYFRTLPAQFRKKTWAENNWYIILGTLIVLVALVFGVYYSYKFGSKTRRKNKRTKRLEKWRERIKERGQARSRLRALKRAQIKKQRQKRLTRDLKINTKKIWGVLITIFVVALIIGGFYLFHETLTKYILYIIGGIVLFAVIISIILTRPKKEKSKPLVREIAKAHKKPFKEIKAKVAEEPEKIENKTLAWLLIVAGFLILLGALFQYSETLRAYTAYIVGGIVILFVFIVLLTVKKKDAIIVEAGQSKDLKYKELHLSVQADKQTNVKFGRADSPAPVPGVALRVFSLHIDGKADCSLTFDFKNAKGIKLYKWSNRWDKVDLRSIDTNNAMNYFDADIDSGTYALVGVRERNTTWLWSVIGLVCMFGLVVLYVPSVQSGDGIPTQILPEGSTHYLDLTSYFADPDEENLTLSADVEGPVTVDIQDSIAKITPDADFTGEAFVTFSATDADGETATSNKVLLDVQNSISYFGKKTLTYILFGLLIISALFVLKPKTPSSERQQ